MEDWKKKWAMIDKVLAIVAEKVDEEQKKHLKSLAKGYDIATEARASEAGTILAMIVGLRNNLWDIEKQL